MSMSHGNQAAGQSRAPGRVTWTRCLPRDTVQPMEATLRISNEITCKHRKLRLQVPGKVSRESGPTVDLTCYVFPVFQYEFMYLFCDVTVPAKHHNANIRKM